ncbi:unnamed protein product [Owenia fusiformis]|uniref:Uncharacterized protein n=1 Tax=Owenia fusiformis TaxID=6347 RepID=A0A8J1TH11_OWEFU|nr:unnamed protein product [Owenia fusiformis]
MEENLTLQADEIEALMSIYGDEFLVDDEAERKYSIAINHDSTSINLQVQLPLGYPSEAPPTYQLSCPWLRGQERVELQNILESIYTENLGESIIYMWIEGVREFLENRNDKQRVTVAKETDTTETEEQLLRDVRDFSITNTVPHQGATYSQPSELAQQNKVQLPEIFHGDVITDRKSVFQPHLAIVTNTAQVDAVLHKLYENKKIANATHNMYAYRIPNGDGGMQQDCDDDGETHAGSRMLHLLQILEVDNVLVIVSRWYGGIQLGPDRFKHINNCTRNILEQHGYVQQKDDKKGPVSSKKNKDKKS